MHFLLLSDTYNTVEHYLEKYTKKNPQVKKTDYKKAMLPKSLALFTLLNTVLCDFAFPCADSFS